MISIKIPDLRPLARFVRPQDLRSAGEMLLKQQTDRVNGGLGSTGKAAKHFKAYTPDYAAERAAAGLSTIRDLRRTGAMLNSREVTEATATRVEIGFVNPKRYFYVNQARTPFVAATTKEREYVLAHVTKSVAERLKQNGGSLPRIVRTFP